MSPVLGTEQTPLTKEEPSLVPRDDSAAVSSPVGDTAEERPSLTRTGQNLAFPAIAVELPCLASSPRESPIPF